MNFTLILWYFHKWIITVHNYWGSFIQKTLTIMKEGAQVRIWEWFCENEQEFMFIKIVDLSLNQSEPQLCIVFEVISPVCPSLRNKWITDVKAEENTYTCYFSITFYSIFALLIMNNLTFSSYIAYWNKDTFLTYFRKLHSHIIATFFNKD